MALSWGGGRVTADQEGSRTCATQTCVAVHGHPSLSHREGQNLYAIDDADEGRDAEIRHAKVVKVD